MAGANLNIGKKLHDGSVVWYLELGDESLILVLTDELFYISRQVHPVQGLRIHRLFVDGVRPETVLADAKRIRLGRIVSVAGEERKGTLHFQYVGLSGLANFGIAHDQVKLGNVQILHEILRSIRMRLGKDACFDHREYSRIRSMIEPAFIALVVVGGTWLFGFEVHKDGGGGAARNKLAMKLIMPVVELIGTVGVVTIGSICLLACAWWAVQRFKDPPIVITVKPGKRQKT